MGVAKGKVRLSGQNVWLTELENSGCHPTFLLQLDFKLYSLLLQYFKYAEYKNELICFIIKGEDRVIKPFGCQDKNSSAFVFIMTA